MKSLKNIALVFAAAFITLGASAQTSGSTGSTGSTTHATKEKTKIKEKRNGVTKTVTKSKPTKKVDTAPATK